MDFRLMHLSAALIIAAHGYWLVLLIVLLLFGGKKIPEVMRGLGEGIRSSRKACTALDKVPRRQLQVSPAPCSRLTTPQTEEKK